MIEKAKRQREGGETWRQRGGGGRRESDGDRRRWEGEERERENKKGGKQRYRARQEVEGETAECCELNEL